jgi:hypothetical protein
MTDIDGTALAVRERDITDLAPRFVISMDELRGQVRMLEEFKREIMLEGVDYGIIPGTPKPTLLKPGAEKLSMVFGLAPTFESANAIEDWEHGFFHYDERCILTSKRSGTVAASANGSANSREPRYRWRKAERVCPSCGKPAIIKGKADYGGGWLCWKQKDGCGAKFGDNDPAIAGQVVGNIENPEPFELVNTIKKMAQKRALVAAVLIATGGSGIWTQDIEDMPSVSGEGQIIDVTPKPEPAKPTPIRQKPNAQLADEKAWDKWTKLCGRADELGIEPPELPAQIGMVQLQAEYENLRVAIQKAKQGAAAPSQAAAQPSDGPEELPTSGPSDSDDEVEF